VRRTYADTVLDAMLVALSGRIHLDETVDTTPEAVLRQLWEDHFVLNPSAAAPG
jgi:MoxR-like ATPase